MNAAQLINYLKTLPPETEIKVLQEYCCDYMIGTNWEFLNPDEHVEFHERAKTLYLGQN